MELLAPASCPPFVDVDPEPVIVLRGEPASACDPAEATGSPASS
jgi:hypothetical protein